MKRNDDSGDTNRSEAVSFEEIATKYTNPNFYAEDTYVVEAFSRESFNSFFQLHRICLIESGVEDVQSYVEKHIFNHYDLTLVLSSETALYEDISGILVDFITRHSYGKSVGEAVSTVAQEVISNAIIHGNLGIERCANIENMGDPTFIDAFFGEIKNKLKDKKYKNKAVVISLKFLNENILIDIKDNGAGFNFDKFVKKYGNVRLRKGMDLVMSLAKDVDYNKDARTMSIVIENPDEVEKIIEPEFENNNMAIGVCSSIDICYDMIEEMLLEEGFCNIKKINIEDVDAQHILSEFDLLLCLSDVDKAALIELLEKVRLYASHIDFPILCQKSQKMQPEIMQKMSLISNDFLSEDIHKVELVARMKAQYSMYLTKQNVLKFFKGYQREIEQSQKTIDFYEKKQVSFFANRHKKDAIRIFINGSNTSSDTFQGLQEGAGETHVPYGHGFEFLVNNKKFVLYFSLTDGLLPILIIGSLRGYTERLKRIDGNVDCEIVLGRIKAYIDKILPQAFELKLVCLEFSSGSNICSYASKGEFTFYYYDSKNNKVLNLYQNRRSKGEGDYTGIIQCLPNDGVVVLDEVIKVKDEEIKDVVEYMCSHKRLMPDSYETSKIVIRNKELFNIPYMLMNSIEPASGE